MKGGRGVLSAVQKLRIYSYAFAEYHVAISLPLAFVRSLYLSHPYKSETRVSCLLSGSDDSWLF